MHERYECPEIKKIWSDESKLYLWQNVELAIMQAKVNLGSLSKDIYEEIKQCLERNPIDVVLWKEKDKVIRHDLNAFLEERLQYFPKGLQQYFHKRITSYDIEEPAFANTVRLSIKQVKSYLIEFEDVLLKKALRYRYTVMFGRTHGQEAELQTFGKRCLCWLRSINVDHFLVDESLSYFNYSKISGAIGNYGGGLDEKIEEEALSILGFTPFYGATQIMPREMYLPVANALSQLVGTLAKIALDIRLGARSGNPIYQEPFGKKQKGSSAMPHKKNTIITEQMEGMARMAKGYRRMIEDNIETWEERTIEQSCVERVAWPDLFHVVIHSLKKMIYVVGYLQVYPDNMLQEIVNSHGCYAASEAKEFLKTFELSAEDAYLIVQLAAFNVKENIHRERKELRNLEPRSLEEAAEAYVKMESILSYKTLPCCDVPIQSLIREGNLQKSASLAISDSQIKKWNEKLKEIFQATTNRKRWNEIFTFSYLLKNEAVLFEKMRD